MLLIHVPKWVSYITLEMDGSIWAYRYDPNIKEEKIQREKKGGWEQEKKTVKLGTLIPISISMNTGTTQIPEEIGKEARYLNGDLGLVTSKNRSYKEHTLEHWIFEDDEKQKKESDYINGYKPYSLKFVTMCYLD